MWREIGGSETIHLGSVGLANQSLLPPTRSRVESFYRDRDPRLQRFFRQKNSRRCSVGAS